MLRCSLALLMLTVATMLPAQTPLSSDYKVTVDVELVQLPVSVMDKHGLPVRGLQPEHFTVYEDKVQQTISLFTQEDIPLSVGMVVDTSGSMLEKVDRLNAAAMTFTQENNPEDDTFLVTFGDEVFLENDFSGDPGELTRILGDIPGNRGTALYDAVFLAAKYSQTTSAHEKRVLLVISDGEDNKSKYSLIQARDAARQAKAIVYTIGLLSSDASLYTFPETGKKALKTLAESTGGTSFFPKNVKEVQEVCSKIARDLRNQYTIGYRPSNQNMDGSWRKVLVQINAPKNMQNLKLRTKQGYYAPRAGTAESGSTP